MGFRVLSCGCGRVVGSSCRRGSDLSFLLFGRWLGMYACCIPDYGSEDLFFGLMVGFLFGSSEAGF